MYASTPLFLHVFAQNSCASAMVSQGWTPTAEEIQAVEDNRTKCQQQFNLSELATSMTRFYELLVQMGFWPEGSILQPPHSTLSSTRLQACGFSSTAISAIQSLPYPSRDKIFYDDRNLFDVTRILDLTDAEDFNNSHWPYSSDDESPFAGNIVALMAAQMLEGSEVLLDCDIGAIHHYPVDTYGSRHWTSTAEWRVACHQHMIPENQDWSGVIPGPRIHKFMPFVPAKQYFDDLYQKFLTLRRLPFLDPRYEGNKEVNLDEVGPPGNWHRELTERKQEKLTALYGRHGWPDFARWDRDGFLKDWKFLERQLNEDARALMHQAEW